MNKWYSLLLLASILFATGCSTAPSAEPEMVANGGAGEAGKINDLPAPKPEVVDPQPVTVPRVKQDQIVSVLREMRANGCIIQKLANTDGIHYSQLVITCGDLQKVPEVD